MLPPFVFSFLGFPVDSTLFGDLVGSLYDGRQEVHIWECQCPVSALFFLFLKSVDFIVKEGVNHNSVSRLYWKVV